MKLHKISALMIGSLVVFASCADINDQEPESGSLTAAQNQETNAAVPSRVDATFAGMYDMLFQPCGTFSSGRPDDWGFGMIAFSNDLEGADVVGQNNGYNWFSTCSELSDRNADYANPYIRYNTPYKMIGICNSIVSSYPEGVTDESSIQKIAQARAMRAFSYMNLAPYFAFGYAVAADSACVPLLRDGVDYTHNPRATVREVYEYVLEDLNYAVEHLDGYARPNKQYIDQAVAYGLRARVNLYLNNWADAASDAASALRVSSATPLSIEEAGNTGFDDIDAHNWMWGIYVNQVKLNNGYKMYANPASWYSPFSGYSYGNGCGILPCINKLLYDKIPSTDVRKGWWLNADLESPLLDKITWNNLSGKALAEASIYSADGSEVIKNPYLPYTSMKFGQKSAIGSTVNNSDWPLMRIEEMYLIQAEGLAKSGQAGQAKTILENFVKTYRDPQYSADASGRDLEDEIWYQRRVELWGEGFFTSDAKRLGKNIVRFHSTGDSNFPAAYEFNISSTDGWLNLRFPTREKDNNLSIVDNSGGTLPVAGQNAILRDGVTD